MKILVIYATAGAGHRKAAEAVYNGLKPSPLDDVFFVDALDYTSAWYKSLYSGSYTFLITKIPWLWGFVFRLLDISCLLPFVRVLRRAQNALHGRRLHRYLQEEDFHYIISTHFFPNEVAAYLKRKGVIRSEIISVITDFDIHSIWLSEGIDQYTVATEWTRDKALKLGLGRDHVHVTGIPTDARFANHRNIRSLKQKLGLKENIFTVLIATGSFGIGPIEEIIAYLPDYQVLVVCGHNKSLYERISRAKKDLVKVYPLVNNMDELMAVADVMITKPGGLSISEALVSHLPLIFFNAIPGQETNNIKVLKEYGVGISNCPIVKIAETLDHFRSSPEGFESAKEHTRALARPDAVKSIVALVSS